MANRDNATGLRPKNGQAHLGEYTIASGYAESIFCGDVVEGVAGGSIEVAEGGNVDNLGVFSHVSYVDSEGQQQFKRFWKASTTGTNIKAYVWDDPHEVFIGQADSATAAAVHALADWDDGTGSEVTGLSGREITAATSGTTGKSLRILRRLDEPGNDWGAHVDVEVQFAEHVLNGVVSGVGGI